MDEPTISISPFMASVIWEAPAETAPPGYTQNLVDPPTTWDTTLTIVSIQVVVMIIAIATRLLSTFVIRKKLLLEDIFFYIAFIIYLAFVSMASEGSEGPAGFGVDIWNITFGQLTHILYMANLCEFTYGLAVLFIKLGMLFHMKRLFAPLRTGNRAMWYSLWALIIAHSLFYTLHEILILAGCVPRGKIWNPLLPGTCIDILALIFATATVNAISDCAIFLIPIIRVWRLRIAKNHKANLSLIFAVGVLGCVSSILRAYYSWMCIDSTNLSSTIYWMGFWSEVELISGFFASAVPFMPKCYITFAPRISSWLHSHRHLTPKLGMFTRKSKQYVPVASKTDSHCTSYASAGDVEAGGFTRLPNPSPPPPATTRVSSPERYSEKSRAQFSDLPRPLASSPPTEFRPMGTRRSPSVPRMHIAELDSRMPDIPPEARREVALHCERSSRARSR